MDLELELNLGEWLSTPVWCKFQCETNDDVIMSLERSHFRRSEQLYLELDVGLDLELHLDLDSNTFIIGEMG